MLKPWRFKEFGRHGAESRTRGVVWDELTRTCHRLPEQVHSDEILRDASHTLHRVELTPATGANRAEHHHRARVSAAEALRGIQAALAVR